MPHARFRFFCFTKDGLGISLPIYFLLLGPSLEVSLPDSSRDPGHIAQSSSRVQEETKLDISAVEFRLPFRDVLDQLTTLMARLSFVGSFSKASTLCGPIPLLPTLAVIHGGVWFLLGSSQSRTVSISSSPRALCAATVARVKEGVVSARRFAQGGESKKVPAPCPSPLEAPVLFM